MRKATNRLKTSKKENTTEKKLSNQEKEHTHVHLERHTNTHKHMGTSIHNHMYEHVQTQRVPAYSAQNTGCIHAYTYVHVDTDPHACGHNITHIIQKHICFCLNLSLGMLKLTVKKNKQCTVKLHRKKKTNLSLNY